ncbi:hypothetical protein HOR11_gp091 [Lactobacillus phage SA-C12]|uniref:Uncharacterized protein n=1 Tax=Lactobacillus phage SA-C12 TaxID=1755697 RepID=A0A1I9KKA8_9CAUD|nr:hypothetical protein HOR11_gp091 [Lactobacillus phage SA-C12]ALY06912.1 hypothetical protein SAC12_091 [Lactobacillus phage SA-C12]
MSLTSFKYKSHTFCKLVNSNIANSFLLSFLSISTENISLSLSHIQNGSNISTILPANVVPRTKTLSPISIFPSLIIYFKQFSMYSYIFVKEQFLIFYCNIFFSVRNSIYQRVIFN